MYVREVNIASFRNLRGVHIGPLPAPASKSELVVLAGPNGGGKSSILELIGFALSNSWGLNWGLRRSFPDHAFEVAIGLTNEELRLVREYEQNNQMPFNKAALDHLLAHRYYFRQFYAKGTRDRERSQLYDTCHNIVTTTLRNHYRRALGFFLKADRFYPPEGFRRERLFEYDQMRNIDHIWSMAYTTSDVQYRDMYDFLIQQRYHFFHRLGDYHYRMSRSQSQVQGVEPEDPLQPYDRLLQDVFPGYAFGEKEESVPTNLYVRLPGGAVIPFLDLSSGEKEVFFLLSFFLRHNVSNAVISIDEPELHLHPELARRLLRNMLAVRPGNQVWLATHNAEIIDEAGRDKTIYIGPGVGEESAVVYGSDEPAAAIQLRSLFGVSGYIGVAKSMVFLEGEESSADRKAFSWLFPERGGTVKLIPAGGAGNLTRINAAVLSILDGAIGVCQFYLVRDRDYLTPAMVNGYTEHASGRLYVLRRNQIENYLLDCELISRVLSDVFQCSRTPDQVEADCRNVCRAISGEVLRDMVAFRLNLLYRPQDFGLGKVLERQSVLDEDGEWVEQKVAEFKQLLRSAVGRADAELQARTTEDSISDLVASCKTEVRDAFTGDGWREVFPGKRILEELARRLDVKNSVALQNSLIKEMAADRRFIPPELEGVVETIAAGRLFASPFVHLQPATATRAPDE